MLNSIGLGIFISWTKDNDVNILDIGHSTKNQKLQKKESARETKSL